MEAYTVRDGDGSTLERELASLDAIRDHNPKYLLTMDYVPVTIFSRMSPSSAFLFPRTL